MAQKRKFEEYHDPDYPQNEEQRIAENENKRLKILDPNERFNKIREIIEREFRKELEAKEQEIMEIDNRLSLAKELLHKVRYAIVSNFYSKNGLEIEGINPNALGVNPNFQSQQTDTNGICTQLIPNQKAIHPSLKSLLGKKTINYEEILKIRPIREAAKSAQTTIRERLKTKKEKRLDSLEINRTIPAPGVDKDLKNNSLFNRESETMIDGLKESKNKEILQPILSKKVEITSKKQIDALNSGREINQTKHLIVVGNTSKYIADENEKCSNGITHKWLIYIQNKTEVPIEAIICKVRFFLHPSYKPNDIVDIASPPFQLSRRGWGEFPVRIQLFFHSRLQQKPVQLVHNLVLDKSLTGLQTMGAETLVEIWLRSDLLPLSVKKEENQESLERNKSADNSISQAINTSTNNKPHIEENLVDFLNKIENINPNLCAEGEHIEPTIIDSPLIENTILPPSLPMDLNKPIKMEQTNRDDCTLRDGGNITSDLPKIKQGPFLSQNSCRSISQENLSEYSNTKEEHLAKTTNETFCNQNRTVSGENSNAVIKQEPTSISNKTIPAKAQIFQKRFLKCIDKEGNAKLIPVLVAPKIISKQQNIATGLKSGLVNTVNPLIKNLNGQLIGAAVQKPSNIEKVSSPLSIIEKSTTNLNGNHPVKLVITNNLSKTTNASHIGQININSPIVTSKGMSNLISVRNLNTPAVLENGTKVDQVSIINDKPNSIGRKEHTVTSELTDKCITTTSTSKKQVIVKDGKMCIIDPIQSKLRQQMKKQESLLKPQISLLKPIVKNDNMENCIRNNSNKMFKHTVIATDHDYTFIETSAPVQSKSINATTFSAVRSANSTQHQHYIQPKKENISISQLVKVNQLTQNYTNNFIKPKSDKILLNPPKSSIVLMQKPRQNYGKDLEEEFLNVKFTTIRYAIEFILKKLPLINKQAENMDYRISFPFIVSSTEIFDNLLLPKQKSNEWFRGKYIGNLLKKHSISKDFPIWNTKEIIIFARCHGYTPEFKKYLFNKNSTAIKTATPESQLDLSDLVKREIKKEKVLHRTITSSHKMYNFINSVNQKKVNEMEEDFIDIDSYNLEDETRNQKPIKKESPLKNICNKMWLPMEENNESHTELINQICRDISISLHPEEIVPGVMHFTAQTILVQCLRSFLDDLLRRSLATRHTNDDNSHRLESNLPNSPITSEEIKKAIKSRQEFDFLTNKYLGMPKIKNESSHSKL